MARLPAPPRRLPPLLALLLMATALAGCAAPPPAPPAPAEPSGTGAGSEAGLVSAQEAANVTAQESEQSEFAKSLDEKFHTHNYWGGSLEKTLMDADVTSAGLVQDGGRFGVLGTVFGTLFNLGFGRGIGATPFELPEGSIVPPEAERIEVSVAWPASTTITGVRLAYRSATTPDTVVLDPFPDGGGMVTIGTNLTENDIPHTTISKWRFWLLPYSDDGPGIFNGTVHVTMKAYRSDTLYVAPPHHDFWGANTTLPMAQNTSDLKGTRVVFPVVVFTPGGNDGDESGFAFVSLPEGVLVPPHTGLLRLTLEWQNNATVPDPFTIRPDVLYGSANRRGFTAPDGQDVDAAGGRATYTITVDPKMVDSPYAEESSWGFLVYLRSSNPAEQGFGFGSVGVFDGHFTLTVVAERETLA